MRIINSIDLDFSLGVAEVEFFKYFIVLLNELCSLNQYVRFHSINLVAESYSQMLARRNPWQRVATKVHWRKRSIFQKKSNAFRFAFLGVWVSAKSEIVGTCIAFTRLYHLLK